ncbi:MAG: tRNA uridine-5-carboxymethylaminomethyl(34) synthesis GTPase MnmE [Candidatus Omnitrophica bacterium]|nr:tRNA uridine-5-carboxymethylaminomethyl(34) synthesis GTPase MnmE [Candidatus Omnitrophota bacterium]
MVKYNLDDTIAAAATAMGDSGIGIVRISGKCAISIADKIFSAKNGKRLSTFKNFTLHYGWIVDSRLSPVTCPLSEDLDRRQDVIDEALLSVMRAPNSFTKEDVVEINCHGGIVAMRDCLELVLANGARLAQPGEFTKRAFLNGRIDLAQAEAVLDIIRAKTDSSLKLGVEQLKGVLSKEINIIRDELLNVLTILEANIDFPDEEIGSVNTKQIRQKLESLLQQLNNLLEGAKCGRLMREGIKVVICGLPNVGKSSLLNAILKQERSIVTPVAGTTRDTIEEVIDIKGIPVRISDTAGILEPRDLVEKKAVERAQKHIQLADLVILVFDGTKKLSQQDLALIRKLKKKPVIAVINKIDARQKIDKDKIRKEFPRVIGISAKKLKNLSLLEDEISGLVLKGKVMPQEPVFVSRQRHIQALKHIQKLVEEARNSLDNKTSTEFIAQDIKEALGHLDDILGKKFSEDLLDKIFSEFCIGK